jgi:cobalt/nickel transport system permease protein
MSRGTPIPLKLGASLSLILGVGALPTEHAWWGLLALPALLALAYLARVPLRPLLLRMARVAPFLLGIAGLALFREHGLRACLGLLAKSSVSVLTLQLLVSTTPVSEILNALRRASVPEVLCNTIALLHRYSFLMVDESKRMQRARASRTLRSSRWSSWRALGNSIGLLFLRTVLRAERVQVAMRARGGA